MSTDLHILMEWINADLPVNGEWWQDGSETFILHAEKLLEKGLSVDEIKMMFSGLYCAVSQEYGD